MEIFLEKINDILTPLLPKYTVALIHKIIYFVLEIGFGGIFFVLPLIYTCLNRNNIILHYI